MVNMNENSTTDLPCTNNVVDEIRSAYAEADATNALIESIAPPMKSLLGTMSARSRFFACHNIRPQETDRSNPFTPTVESVESAVADSPQGVAGKPKKKTPRREHFQNQERDELIFKMRLEGKPFKEICDYVNEKFDEMLGENAAAEALRRYCKSMDIPYPYGKRGRKQNR
jgi:hypothetical protein